MAQIPNNTNIMDIINTINSLSDNISKIATQNIKLTDIIKLKTNFKVISSYLDEITSLFIGGKMDMLYDNTDKFTKFIGCKDIIHDMISTINSISNSLSSAVSYNIQPTDIIKIKLNLKYISYYINEVASLFNSFELDNLDKINKNIKIINDIIGNMESINNILSNVKKYNRKELNILTNIIFDLCELINVLEKEYQKFTLFDKISKIVISSLHALNTVITLLKAIGGFSGTGVGLYKTFKWSLLADTLTDIVKVMGVMVLMVPVMTAFIILSPIIFLSMKLFMFFVRFMIKLVIKDLNFFGIKQYINIKMTLNMIQDALMEVVWLSIKVILMTPLILIAAIASPILFGSVYILFWAIRGIIHSINIIPTKSIFSAIGRLTIISLLLLAIGAIVLLFALEAIKVVENWKNVLIFFGIVIAYIGIVLLIGGLLSMGGPLIASAIIGLGATLFAVTLFSLIALQLLLIQNLGLDSVSIRGVVTNIKNIVNDIINILFANVDEPNTKESGFFSSLLSAFGTSIIGFTKAILSIPVLVATVVSIGIITFIATQLRWLQVLNLNKEIIFKNVSSVLGTARMITDMLFAPIKDQKEAKNKTWFQSVVDKGIDWFAGKQFVSLIQSILAVGVLAASFVSTTLILFMATELRLLQNLNLNKDAIKNNVGIVISTAKDVVDMLFDPMIIINDTKGDSWWDDCINWAYKNIPGFSHIGEILNAIISVGTLALTTISVSLLLFMATELRMLQAINLDPNIKDKVHNILGTARAVISSLWDGTYDLPDNKKSWDRKLLEFCLPDSMVLFVDAISNIGIIAPLMISLKMFSVIAEELQKLSKYNNIGSSKAKIIVNNVLSDAKAITASLNDVDIDINSKLYKKIKVLNDLGKSINAFAAEPKNLKDQEKAINNVIKFIDSINNVKLENLQTTHKLFKEMKEFSESISGNFEGLANALNEKIAPLLEELKEMIGKIPASVDKSASTISGSVYNSAAWSGGIATPSSMEEQLRRENPSMSKEDVDKLVDQRMTQQSQSIYKGMEMKMEEILEALQNYSNPIPVRMS